MSMEIDLSTPLTDDERQYLLMRGRLADIERADSLNGVETPDAPEGDGTGPKPISLMTSEQRATEAERLRARLAEIEGDADESDEDEDVEPEPYDAWTVQELDAELKRRQLPTSGTKAEKVKRLEEDDAAATA